jgi:quercetin dioxygenase-like cupin family protein
VAEQELEPLPDHLHAGRKVERLSGLSYEGEEFVYVLQGRLGFFVGDQNFELDPGDCIFVDGSLPHGGRALDGKTCVALFIAVPR